MIKRILMVSTFFAIQLQVFPVESNAEDTLIKSKSARTAYAATQSFFKKHPELKANYIPADLVNNRALLAERSVSYTIDGDASRTTRLNTVLNGLLDFGRALLWKTDSKNIFRTYSLLYPKLPKKYRTKLLTPKQLRGKTSAQMALAYNNFAKILVKNFSKILIEIRPGILEAAQSNFIHDCGSAVGYESAGADSESSLRCDLVDYNPNGLMATTTFPLKDNLTCVKNQGGRGTCSAHAMIATAESLALVGGAADEDLSEQYMYYYAETEGDSQVSQLQTQLYGSSVSFALDAMVRLRLGLYYESSWNYNRSSLMHAPALDPVTQLYYHDFSCTNLYTGEACSEYPWQTQASFVGLGRVSPGAPPALPTTKVHTIRSSLTLLGMGAGTYAVDSTLQSAILMLASDVPVIITFAATDNFVHTTDGYVRKSAGDAVQGAHAIEAVGFIPNANLPVGVTPAAREGYFVIKNSWSTDAGDCGFYYLDYDYLRAHTYYIDVLEIR